MAGGKDGQCAAAAADPVSAAEITETIWEKHVFVCTGGDWCATVDGDGLGVHSRLKKLVA
jgi:hypothetical protein